MDVFYQDGLRFECQRCSCCCRHDPGYVLLSQGDLDRLAERFAISAEAFTSSYCRIVSLSGVKRLSLKEMKNFDCIFWSDGGCTVYEERPLQCRSFPFWPQLVVDRETWEKQKSGCPGIGKGPLHQRQTIDEWLQQRRDEPFITIP